MTRAHRLLHLSDLHLTGTGVDMDGVDARAALTGLLHDLRHQAPFDAVVVSGDVADDGSTSGVRLATDLVGAWAADRGEPVVWTTGNHDDRAVFGEVLGDSLPGRGPGCTSVRDVGGLRVVGLDSLVAGETAGDLDDEQLGWLAQVLADPAPHGTVVVLHHPPVWIGSLPAMRATVLQGPERLADVVRGTDVRAILAGHLHHQLSGVLAGVPVHVAPGVVTRVDLGAPPGVLRAVRGAGAGVLELSDGGGSPTYHLLQARAGDPTSAVYAIDVESDADVPDV